jgi:hypothetical protein
MDENITTAAGICLIYTIINFLKTFSGAYDIDNWTGGLIPGV